MSGEITYKVPCFGLRMVRERTVRLALDRVTSPADAALLAARLIGDKPTEHLIAILLDGTNRVTGVTTLSQGGMHTSSVRVPDVLRAVLASHASAYVLAHNHPSGDPTPSRADVELTSALSDASTLVGVRLFDHVVVVARGGGYERVPFEEGTPS